MKNCGVFLNRDTYAYQGEEMANVGDDIKEVMIYSAVFKSGLS